MTQKVLQANNAENAQLYSDDLIVNDIDIANDLLIASNAGTDQQCITKVGGALSWRFPVISSFTGVWALSVNMCPFPAEEVSMAAVVTNSSELFYTTKKINVTYDGYYYVSCYWETENAATNDYTVSVSIFGSSVIAQQRIRAGEWRGSVSGVTPLNALDAIIITVVDPAATGFAVPSSSISRRCLINVTRVS